jgi:hypothetical protein
VPTEPHTVMGSWSEALLGMLNRCCLIVSRHIAGNTAAISLQFRGGTFLLCHLSAA